MRVGPKTFNTDRLSIRYNNKFWLTQLIKIQTIKYIMMDSLFLFIVFGRTDARRAAENAYFQFSANMGHLDLDKRSNIAIKASANYLQQMFKVRLGLLV